MQIILIIILAILLMVAWPFLLALAATYALYRLTRFILKERYFRSQKFLAQKQALTDAVTEYNELANYIDSFETMDLNSTASDRHKYAHLAQTNNTSKHNIKRNRNTRNLNAANIHQSSLSVVKKASEEPLKYLCKYFDIKPTEETLQQVQELNETISRFTNADYNLKTRLEKIKSDINPPKFIKKYYTKDLLKHLDISLPEIKFKTPEYIFEYVSSGGNSSQRTTIKLDEYTLECLAEYLDERIKYNKSAKAQRSLMTRKLREFVKDRDHHTCQICTASTAQQSLLLLEVDHILPVSKGGLSTLDNLQTLCWKCNRTKSNKV